jgi:hypothetical protein
LESVFGFFPARQVLEIILNESFKNTKIALIEWLWKENKVLSANQSMCGFFRFECCFENGFWNFFIFSSLSQIYKIRNAWKLPSPFLRNSLLSSSEKTFWNFTVENFEEKECVAYLQEVFLFTMDHRASRKLDQNSRICTKKCKFCYFLYINCVKPY